jgi:predicted PurR-regulated permease PerM
MAPERADIDAPERTIAASEDIAELHPQSAARRGLTVASTAAAAEIVIAAFVVFAACYFAKLELVVLLVSILFSFMLLPIADHIERLRIPRPVAAAIAVLLLTALVGGTIYYSASKAQDFARELPKYSGRIRGVLSKYARRAQQIQKSTQNVLPSGDENQNGEKQKQQTVVVQQQSNWTDYITRSFGSITEVIFGISFIPFLVYFMLSWREHVRAATVMLFRMENRNTAYVTLGAISKMIRVFIVGNVVVGVFMSIVAVAVFGLLGIPYFYFVGIISGFVSLIPYLGVVLAMVPPLVTGIGKMHGSEALVVVLTVLLLHVFSLNVLYPKIVGARVQLNPLAVTLALLVWGGLWGAMGLILAVPITAAIKIVFDHIDSLQPMGSWLGE